MASIHFTQTATRQHLHNVWSSPRLRYVKLDHTDAAHRAAMSRNWSNPASQATVNLSLVEPINQAGVENRMKMFGEIALLAVVICLPGEDDHSPGQIIGNILLRPGMSKDLMVNRRGEIGIVIGDEFQRKGYGREAINWIMDWGFGQVGLHSIAVEAATYNEGALHLYKSIGFQEDGRARQARFFGDKWYDIVMMSMLEEEWRALRTAQME